MGKRLVDQKEMADMLGISTRQLYRLRVQGKIPSVKAGKRNRRYDPEEVLEALKKGEEDEAENR